jgi:hypothetical protein
MFKVRKQTVPYRGSLWDNFKVSAPPMANTYKPVEAFCPADIVYAMAL